MAKPKSKNPQGMGTFEEMWATLQNKEKPLPAHSQFRTGSYYLDLQICPRNPGIPAGTYMLLYGVEQSGKSTLTLHMVREHTVIDGLKTVFIDVEGGLQQDLCSNYGINKFTTPNFYYYKPDFLNDGLNRAAEVLLYHYHNEPTEKVLVIIDGVGLGPIRPATKDSDPNQHAAVDDVEKMCQAATLMSNFAKFKTVCAKTNCLVVITNHATEDINATKYQKKEYLGGGVKIKGASDLTLLMKPGFVNLSGGDKIYGKDYVDEDGSLYRKPMVMEFRKNKLSTQKPDIEYWLIIKDKEKYGGYFGIDEVDLCVSYLVSRGVITRSGSWFSLGEHKAQGLDALVDMVWNSPDLQQIVMEHTRDQVRAQYGT